MRFLVAITPFLVVRDRPTTWCGGAFPIRAEVAIRNVMQTIADHFSTD